MARGFRRKKGRIVGDLDPIEREVVLDVLRRTAELLAGDDASPGADGGGEGPTPAPAHADRGDAGGPDAPGGPSGLGAAGDPGGHSDHGDPGDPGAAGASDDAVFEAMMRRAGLTGEPGGVDDAGDAPEPADAPVSTDPAIRRLLPDGHRDDPEAAAAFRKLSAENVRAAKLTHLHRAVAALEAEPGRGGTRVDLDDEDAVALLRALTDVRLVLAERLDLHSDDDVEHLEAQLAHLRAGDERAQAMLAYDFLTWLQETLAAALLPG